MVGCVALLCVSGLWLGGYWSAPDCVVVSPSGSVKMAIDGGMLFERSLQPVDAWIYNRRGDRVGNRIAIGFYEERVRCEDLFFYEDAAGNLAGLSHRKWPGYLIAIINIEEERYFNYVGARPPKQMVLDVDELEKAVGKKLAMGGEFLFDRGEFLRQVVNSESGLKLN